MESEIALEEHFASEVTRHGSVQIGCVTPAAPSAIFVAYPLSLEFLPAYAPELGPVA